MYKEVVKFITYVHWVMYDIFTTFKCIFLFYDMIFVYNDFQYVPSFLKIISM